MYKLLYVPANFEPNKNGTIKQQQGESFGKLKTHQQANVEQLGAGSKISLTKRACFSVKGGVGFTIQPQTVLPDLSKFEYNSTVQCPQANPEFSRFKCELWKMSTEVGERKNTYKMWIHRKNRGNIVVPVHYYMLGYDNLLGSHYDRYDVTYTKYKPNGARDNDFALDLASFSCGAMPGPGDDSSDAHKRSHIVMQNPIHEYVAEPERYDHIDHEFSQFTNDQQKRYPSENHERRGWFNFLHNFRFINGKNRELKHYKLNVNKFADNNVRELSYLRGRLHSSGYNGGLDYAEHHDGLRGLNGAQKDTLPDTWDWSIRGAVTPVKDQAVCGSCWSFGTSGTIEGAYFVKTGHLPVLSQQQMVDCSWKYGNNGCDGGEDFRAYKYIVDAGGLSTEEDYGNYIGVDGKCHDNETPKTVQISGFYNVTRGDPEAMKHAIVNYGPVTIAIDASQPTFTFYSHGVYYDDKCNNNPDGLDHQVLAVGYITINGQLAWLVKNSWSTHWGNNGYILMSAKDNNCGVMDAPTVPIIKV